MNPFDVPGDYGNANWDIRHRFVASVVYDLPSFNGRNPLLHWVIGGWQINDITTLQRGTPFNVTIPKSASVTRSGPSISNCMDPRLASQTYIDVYHYRFLRVGEMPILP